MLGAGDAAGVTTVAGLAATNGAGLGLDPETGGIQRLWAIRLVLIGAIRLYPALASGSIGVPHWLRQTTLVEGIFSPASV